MKKEILVNVDESLYLSALDNMDMGFDEFVEYSLIMYMNASDDEYSRLFRKGVKAFNEFNNIKEKLYSLQSRDDENFNTESKEYQQTIDTINRIHSSLGYIGRNQIRKIANQNNINPNKLIKHLEDTGYNIENFGAMPK